MNESKLLVDAAHGDISATTVGLLARALTYPILSAEYDFTLRELNALATLAQAEADSGEPAPVVDNDSGAGAPATAIEDTYDLLSLIPNGRQAFWQEQQFLEAVTGLKQKGLVNIESKLGLRIVDSHKGVTSSPVHIVTLTRKGKDLVDELAGHVAHALNIAGILSKQA
ncbi:hypothetical protein [Silvimonas iriomotensis]|uniref:Transcriptional regulator n=1 Tax=Silvimonas iriomotensis TaxID=449662 RepID=A0ABQ2PA06_9NEIS|nr:hypothetical protein [Silvimonas iriomotensis]GGP21901.1 hypothetical protein GCM10010970_22770 [Silvimonas iriomotensis]